VNCLKIDAVKTSYILLENINEILSPSSICCTRSLFIHFMPCFAQYSWPDFFGIRMDFIDSAIDLVIFLFIFFTSEVKICTSTVNQLPIVWHFSFIRTRISYARNQQTLHSRNINLCTRWPHYE